MIEFCKSSGLRIANGRIGSDKDLGQFTYLGKKGNSVVDYFLLDQNSFDLISEFRIGDISDFSDHTTLKIAIACGIPINGNQENNSFHDKLIFDNDPSINELIKNHSVKYKSNEIKSGNTGDKEIELEHLFSDLEKSIDDDDVPIETCVDRLRKISLEISDTHFSKIKFQEKSKQKNSYQALRDNKFWYDKKCKNEKKEMNKLRRAYK